MNFNHPKDWVEICEDAVQAALDTIDHRQNERGYYYERYNLKEFMVKQDGQWFGHPDYFAVNNKPKGKT